MGPFPHDAPKAKISNENPAGTDGFEFVEFAHPDPDALRELFTKMGYTHTATHKTKQIELWQQGDITYILNNEPGSQAMRFVEEHGPCAPSMGWRVVDAKHAYDRAVMLGATPYDGNDKAMDVPAIVGIGGSLIYFIDKYYGQNPYNDEFNWVSTANPEGVGFHYLDHLTHNVHKGNMDTWFDFYGKIFGFKEIRFFDIEGKFSGLLSRALTSPADASVFRSTKTGARPGRSSNTSNGTRAKASSTSRWVRATSTMLWTRSRHAGSSLCRPRRRLITTSASPALSAMKSRSTGCRNTAS